MDGQLIKRIVVAAALARVSDHDAFIRHGGMPG